MDGDKQKRVGIIGGLGPSATIDLMDKIVKNTPAEKDQDHLELIIEYNPKIPDRTGFLLHGGENPLPLLTQCARNLQKRGADFIVIPCNTAHAFVGEIQKHITIPIVNMVAEAVSYLQEWHSHVQTAGLLATSGTVASRIYHLWFEKSAVQLIQPDEAHQQLVMEAIYGDHGIKAGHTQGSAKEYVMAAACSLVRQGAQGLILGCTELPLVLEESHAFALEGQKVVILDPTHILAKKCVSLAM